MEPIQESRAAVDDYGPFTHDHDLLEHLGTAADRVRRLVPTCVGVTLALVREGVAFTLVASDEEVAALDAAQYVDDGPCVAAARDASPVMFEVDDPADEARWQLFARASAARGVRSTLTLPILSAWGDVTGSVNLYAASSRAFDERHAEMADIFGAWAGGAVTNADLDFATLELARRAPSVLHSQLRVSQAVGQLMAERQIDEDAAGDLLTNAAARAGVELAVIAELVLESSTDTI